MVDSLFLSINSLTRKESLKNLARITFLRIQRSNPAQTSKDVWTALDLLLQTQQLLRALAGLFRTTLTGKYHNTVQFLELIK